MRKNKAFIFTIVFSLIIAAIPVIYSVYCLINSYIVPVDLILLLVVAFAVSLLFVFVKKIPGGVRAALSVLWFLLTTAVFMLFVLFGVTVEFRAFDTAAEINSYYNENSRYDDDFDFDEFGEYESISNYKYHSMAIFSQLAYTTILKYDEENYINEKNNIENNYEFYTEPVEKDFVPVFSYNDFDFRIEISDWYPKQLHLVGTNDETREIAHIYFEDYDLDFISDSEDFLEFYCGWLYVMKERS